MRLAFSRDCTAPDNVALFEIQPWLIGVADV
jgi:hypothetical protein